MQRASVYLFGNRYFFSSFSEGVSGIWYTTPPYLTLSIDSSDVDLGIAVLTCLTASRQRAREPQYPVGQELLSLAGVESWMALERDGQCLEVTREAERIEIVAMVHSPHSDGLQEGESSDLTIAAGAETLLGGAIRERLAR